MSIGTASPASNAAVTVAVAVATYLSPSLPFALGFTGQGFWVREQESREEDRGW